MAATKAAAGSVVRFVAKVDWVPFGAKFEVCDLDVCGLPVTALPVLHGADYVCYGYSFGEPTDRVVYLSDYTALLPPTEALLERWSAARQVGLLILDALLPRGSHPVHASLEESVGLARRLRPRRCLLVGMSHAIEHEATCRELRKLRADGLDVQLARDGQFVPFDLRGRCEK